jgi:hypothetical protein
MARSAAFIPPAGDLWQVQLRRYDVPSEGDPMTTARERLEKEYGSALPPGLAGLSDEQHARLADAIDAARTRQDQALAKATDSGLDFVPKLLRGTVKKVIFG